MGIIFWPGFQKWFNIIVIMPESHHISVYFLLPQSELSVLVSFDLFFRWWSYYRFIVSLLLSIYSHTIAAQLAEFSL